MREIIIYSVLVFLPGSWVTFGPKVGNLKIRTKLLVGAVLSPIIVYIQFNLLRILGISFEKTANIILGINSLAIVLIFYNLRKKKEPLINPSQLASFSFVLIVILAALSPQLINPQIRAYNGHAWMHTDVVYMLANGQLIPEDPQLAGVRLAYPWAGHVFQGLISYLINVPPTFSYIWSNVLWLILLSGIAAEILSEFGGGVNSKIIAITTLLLGLNFFGYPLHLGDYRYTPWVLKYYFFNQMPFAFGLFTGVIYLGIRYLNERYQDNNFILMSWLISGIGIIYPILFPPAIGILTAIPLVIYLHREKTPLKFLVPWALVIIGTTTIFLVHYSFVFKDSVVFDKIRLNLTMDIFRKLIDWVIALVIFWLGYLFFIIRKRDNLRKVTTYLGLGALISITLYMSILMQGRNEYKFMFTATLCLMPFSGLASEKIIEKLGVRIFPTLVILVLILSLPLVHKNITDWPFVTGDFPQLDSDGFNLNLSSEEPLAGITTSLQNQTPVNTMLVLNYAAINYPTLTRRVYYIAPEQKHAPPGFNWGYSDLLENIKGYDKKQIAERRSVINTLYGQDEPSKRSDSLNTLLSMGRSVAIIMVNESDRSLIEWLWEIGVGHEIYADNDHTIWLIDSSSTQ